MTINASHNERQSVLVANGTGKTGRRVVERLLARGLVERLLARGVAVRVGSRAGDPPFDWQDPDTWTPALSGMDTAYISYHPDLAAPGASDAIAARSGLAVENGTRRLVLLSGRGEEEAQRSEEALEQSGADWTVLRCSWFMQNFSESYFLEPLLAGELALPADGVPEPFVDADDIADLAEAGVPNDVVLLLSYLFTEVLDGRNAHLTDGVQRALGRPPRDFSAYARDRAATGIWSGSAIAA